MFTGFKPAIDACQLTWADYPIEGVTFNNAERCQMTDVWHPDRKPNKAATTGHVVSGRKVAATYRSSYDSGGEGASSSAAAAAVSLALTPPFDIPTPSFALSNPGAERKKHNSSSMKHSAQVAQRGVFR